MRCADKTSFLLSIRRLEHCTKRLPADFGTCSLRNSYFSRASAIICRINHLTSYARKSQTLTVVILFQYLALCNAPKIISFFLLHMWDIIEQKYICHDQSAVHGHAITKVNRRHCSTRTTGIGSEMLPVVVSFARDDASWVSTKIFCCSERTRSQNRSFRNIANELVLVKLIAELNVPVGF